MAANRMRRRATQLARLIFIFVTTSTVAACVTVNKSILDRSHIGQRVPKEAVQVYLANDTLPPHERIAILNAKGNEDFTNESQLIDKLRDEAGKLGANAIVLGEIKEASVGARVASVVFGTPADRRGQAVAIYVANVTAQNDPDIQRLVALQHKLAAAMAPFDSVALDSIVAPDFQSINAGDQRLDKAAVFRELRQAQGVLRRAVDDSIHVRRYGNTAIMTLRETVHMQQAGSEVTGRLRLTGIWLKRNGRWQVVGGQATAIP